MPSIPEEFPPTIKNSHLVAFIHRESLKNEKHAKWNDKLAWTTAQECSTCSEQAYPQSRFRIVWYSQVVSCDIKLFRLYQKVD